MWHYFELFPFIIVALLGGLIGCVFIKLNIKMCYFRKHSPLKFYPITEAMSVAAITAIVSYLNPYLSGNSGGTNFLHFILMHCNLYHRNNWGAFWRMCAVRSSNAIVQQRFCRTKYTRLACCMCNSFSSGSIHGVVSVTVSLSSSRYLLSA